MKWTLWVGVAVVAWQSVGAAQTLPSIASSRGEYVLTIPYLNTEAARRNKRTAR